MTTDFKFQSPDERGGYCDMIVMVKSDEVLEIPVSIP